MWRTQNLCSASGKMAFTALIRPFKPKMNRELQNVNEGTKAEMKCRKA